MSSSMECGWLSDDPTVAIIRLSGICEMASALLWMAPPKGGCFCGSGDNPMLAGRCTPQCSRAMDAIHNWKVLFGTGENVPLGVLYNTGAADG